MPKFALPDSTITDLVRLVRLLDARRGSEPDDAGAAADAPSEARPSPDAGSRSGARDAGAER
jgi:hypothetical protein